MQVQRILSTGSAFPFPIPSAKIALPELQGEPIESEPHHLLSQYFIAGTFLSGLLGAVSEEKVKLAALEVGGPVMCEDTSLCFVSKPTQSPAQYDYQDDFCVSAFLQSR